MKILKTKTAKAIAICSIILSTSLIILWQGISQVVSQDVIFINYEAQNSETTKEEITRTADHRKLLALAYKARADMRTGQMTPDNYTECMLILSEKLEFAITDANLQKAYEEENKEMDNE